MVYERFRWNREENEDFKDLNANREEIVIQKLRQKGCRITKQRLILLKIILNNQCASCKEIYALALKEDSKIGIATVYRMVNILEEIGAINRTNMYKICLRNNS